MSKSYQVIYTEITSDKGYLKLSYASDNYSTYKTTSAHMHDAISNYQEKYDRNPSAAWYRKHSRWEKKRLY